MPQMSSLLWTIMILQSIMILLTISSFLYFMSTPSPQNFISTNLLLIKSMSFH